jgi:hypothetical protein
LCTAKCGACSSKEHNGSLCPRIWASRAWYRKRLARALRDEVERPSIRPPPDDVVLMGKDPEKWRPVLKQWSPITEDEPVSKKRAADEELEVVRAAKVGRKLALDCQKQLEARLAAGVPTLSVTASVFVPQAQSAGLAEDSLAAAPEGSASEAWAELRALFDGPRDVEMQVDAKEEEEFVFDAVHIKQEEQ